MKPSQPLALALLSLLIAFPASAAGLTLAETLQTARSRSLGVLGTQERLSSLEAQQSVAKAPSLPSLTLQTGGGYATKNGGVDSSLSLSQTLLDFDGNRHAQNIADKQVQIGRLALWQAEQDAMANAAVAFFQAQRAEAGFKLSTEALKQAQEHLRLVELRLKAGSETRASLLLMKARLSSANVAKLQARNAVVMARLDLFNQLNLPPGDRPIAPTSFKPTSFKPEALSEAVARRPEVQAQLLRVSMGTERQELEKSSSKPGISATGRYSEHNLSAGDLFMGLNLSWSLFDGFKSDGKVRAAQADTRAEQVVMEQVRQAAELDIRQQMQAKEEAKSRLIASKEGLLASTEAYRIALHRYELGLSTQLELIDVQNTLLSAKNSALQAESDLSIAEIRLCRATACDLGK